MKLRYKIILSASVLLVVLAAACIIYLQQLKPKYSGELILPGLHQPVEIIFDHYGVPHIYGRNEEDAYFALGYVHAQERLFQMEIVRRIGAGRLAEIFGEELVKTDKFFRTLGIPQTAAKNAERFFKDPTTPFQKAALAYLAGINQFVEKGDKPLEFQILGIPREKFTPKDIYLIGAFMVFGFAEGFRMDPLVAATHHKLGWEYLKDWIIGWPPGAQKIPVYRSDDDDAAGALAAAIDQIIDNLPMSRWIGSNGWVISGKKTKTGKVILANDTHMAYAQPAIWYEAHLEYPGFSFYGYHAAGVPFGLIGYNRRIAWGLTMFENDDVDFYKERLNPQNPDQVWANDHWQDLTSRREIIKVKGGADIIFEVRASRHGPIINSVDELSAQTGQDPVAVWWLFNKLTTTSVHAFYRLAHAQNIDAARQAVSMIDALGVNVMYGDQEGNIAWWAAAKLIKRPDHVNSKLFLDGASGKDEPLGYYDFKDNPRSENPPAGFVYSANNQPDDVAGNLYPGYYVPDNRARRILELMAPETIGSTEAVKKMSTDCVSPVFPEVVKKILATIQNESVLKKTPNHELAYRLLEAWDGDHQIDDVSPTIFYKLISHIVNNTFFDELGEQSFKVFVSSHLMKRTLPVLIDNDSSLWWDNIDSKDIHETRRMIFAQSFDQTLMDLNKQFGSDMSGWQWGKVHTLEHGHPLGLKKPLNKIFNVGPFPAMGGNEVLVNTGFRLNTEGLYPVYFGPAMRFIVDFSNNNESFSVIPTGQSGYFLSDHYDDQSPLYNTGKFRRLLMDQAKIRENQEGLLILSPE
jgi:penicillin G amidase